MLGLTRAAFVKCNVHTNHLGAWVSAECDCSWEGPAVLLLVWGPRFE